VFVRRHLQFMGFTLTAGCLLLGAFVVDWPLTLQSIADANRPLIALAVVLLIATFCIFALRWRQLIAIDDPLPFRHVFNFLMIGYLANAVLPARPGDIIRAVLWRQSYKISFSIGVASVVLERLFDVLAVCMLGFSVSLVITLPAAVVWALYSFAAAAGGLIVVLMLLGWRQTSFQLLLSRYPKLSSHPGARFVIEWLRRFVLAINVVRSPTRLALSVALTCVGWGMLGLYLMIMVIAFRLPAPLAAALLVLVLTNLGAAIPSSPSSLGVYHVLAVLGLSVWNIDTSAAVAFAIGSHALVITLQILIGLACAWFEGWRIIGLKRLATEENSGDMLPASRP
jgi:glycosyltransferase 2 family protein